MGLFLWYSLILLTLLTIFHNLCSISLTLFRCVYIMDFESHKYISFSQVIREFIKLFCCCFSGPIGCFFFYIHFKFISMCKVRNGANFIFIHRLSSCCNTIHKKYFSQYVFHLKKNNPFLHWLKWHLYYIPNFHIDLGLFMKFLSLFFLCATTLLIREALLICFSRW